MENNEEYQKLKATIKQLEQQQSKLDNNGLDPVAVERQIREHFAQCVNALAARQEALLKDLYAVANTQNKAVTSARTSLSTAIDAHKKVLEAGSLLYSTSADLANTIWKEAAKLHLPQVSGAANALDLPNTLLQSIQAHGKVTGIADVASPPAEVQTTTGSCTSFVVEGDSSSTLDRASFKAHQEYNHFAFIPTPAKFNSEASVTFAPNGKNGFPIVTFESITNHPDGRSIKFTQAFNLPFDPAPKDIQLQDQILRIYF